MSTIGSLVIGSENKPLGYVTPRFPGLHASGGNALYSTYDIFRFVLYWNLIMSTSFHLLCGLTTIVSMRKLNMQSLMPLLFFGLSGAFFGFMVGSLSGLLFGGIYIAGVLHMPTWIPFAWSFVPVLYLALTTSRYSFSAM